MAQPLPVRASTPSMASTAQPEYHAPHPMSRGRDAQAADWVRDHGRAIGVGAVVVALLGVGGVAWRGSERAKAQRAEQAFFQAQAGAQGNPAAAERALRDVATRYRGTPGGAQATLLLAQALYDQGRFQDGITVLGRADAPEEFRDAVRVLTAAGYEGVGRGADAGRLYEELANAPGVVARRRDELRAAAARAYQLAGDRTSAARLWGAVASSGTGPIVDEARVRLGELRG